MTGKYGAAGRTALLALAAVAAAAGRAEAQSVAASLGGYESVLRVSSVAGINAKSFSGVALHPATHTLYVIDNDNAVVYELSPAGALLRAIATTGFLDPEGIAYQGDDYFLIAEEGLANVVRIKLPRTGTGPVAKSSGTTLNLGPNMANSGIEGVAYRAADKLAFAVKEIDPPRLYRITLDESGNPKASFPDDPFAIGSKGGDAADLCALNDGNFMLVNQEQDKLEGLGPNGQALSSLTLGLSKPEGIAYDSADGAIYVVGEPLQFAVFRKKGAGLEHARPDGFACALERGNSPVTGAVVRYSLPGRVEVRIETGGVDGAWIPAFRGAEAQGEHAHAIAPPRPGSGIRLVRFSAGAYRRAFLLPPF